MPEYIVVKRHSSIFAAFLWMLVLSILLSFIPFGQFIAGLVGGKKAGSVGRAIMAFFIPAIVLSIFLIFAFPIIPFVVGPLSVVMIASNAALFIGAVVGGALA